MVMLQDFSFPLATLLKWGTAKCVWEISDEGSLFLATLTFEVPFSL